MNPNPLSQYFRQPAIYIRLPSQGNFYPKGSIDMPANGEVAVLPMTTVDEITYRTPDALFNGSAVVSVIQSCVPAIKDGWKIPAMDIDTLLMAIRIATYGHEIDLDSDCPKCQHENRFGLDLRTLMDKVKPGDYQSSLDIGDLQIFFRPLTYQDLTKNNLSQFEDQKTMQMLDNPDIPIEQRNQAMGDMLKRITDVTIDSLSHSILTICTPTATVTEREHILEWLKNCDRAIFAKVRDRIVKNKQASEVPPIDLKCQACENPYQQNFSLDMTNFFGDAS